MSTPFSRRLRLAGLTICLSGSGDVGRSALSLLEAFPDSDDSEAIDLSISEDGIGYKGVVYPHWKRGDALSLAMQLTTLLRYMLHDLLPQTLVLHGNAVLMGELLVVLVGASGSGKTTLARRLGFVGGRMVSEDMILLDPKLKILHPWPRASSIRPEAGGALKTLESFPTTDCRPIPIGDILYVLLDSKIDPPGGPATNWKLMLAGPSVSPPLDILGGHGWIIADENPASNSGSYTTFHSSKMPTWSDLHQLALALWVEQWIILEVSEVGSSERSERRFPSMPSMQQLETWSALEQMATHAVSGYLDRQHPAEWIMDFASCSSEAGFIQLRPGGTPDDTLALLLSILSDGLQ